MEVVKKQISDKVQGLESGLKEEIQLRQEGDEDLVGRNIEFLLSTTVSRKNDPSLLPSSRLSSSLPSSSGFFIFFLP